jgi:hypothetical protein
VKEEDSSEYRWILKNLKARSSIVDENETYEFSGNEEDYRFLYERMGSREISLKELNNKTEMVRQFILRNPTDKYTPKQVSTILQLNNAKWAANILSGLNGRGEIGKIEATDINTGGRKTYYYFAKGKPPI